MEKKSGIARLLYAFKYSWEGLCDVFKKEEAFRIEIFLCILFSPIIYFLQISLIEKIILSTTLFFVLMAELTNTAIERTIDRISNEIHPLSKAAKDIGSCLVALSLFYSFFIWLIILWKNFI
jgi:diacylglycerol kinase (ATP)